MARLDIDSIETERLLLQDELDGRRTAGERNRLGQFATPPDLALQMAALAGQHVPAQNAVRFLDPGFGSGVFLYAALKEFGRQRLQQALGFEVDPEVAAIAEKLWGHVGFSLRVEDFCRTRSPDTQGDCAMLGNLA